MLKLALIPVVVAGLIAVPCAVAHGKASHHVQLHASARHASQGHRGSKADDRNTADAQANQPESRSARQPDEEELEIDEVASQAK